MAASSAGTVTLAGGNNITLSTGNSAITISGPNTYASHAVQTGISAISNSDTTFVSGTVGLSALTNITIRSTTGNQFQFSVADPTGGAETQTAISGLANSETTYTSGTVNLSGLGAAIVRSTTGNAFQVSVPAQSTQVETQTFVGGISNSETQYTSGTVNLSGLGEVVVRSTTGNAFQISAPAHTVQTGISAVSNSDTTYVSGTIGLSALTNITIRSTTGQQFQFSGNPAQSVQAESLSFGVSTGGNTVGDTGVATGQRIVMSGQGQVSLSQATGAGSTTVGISVPNSHAVQTGVSGISNSETVYTSGTVNLSGLGEVVVRSTTGNAFQISAPAHTVQTGISGISNSETQYTSGTVNISGLGAVVVRSTTGNAFQISVPSQTVQAESLSFGLSTGGNTAGNTGVATGQQIVLSGQGQVTLSESTGANSTTIGFSVPDSHAVQTGISAISNSNTTYTSGTVGLSALTNITIRSTTGNQFQFSVADPGAAAAPVIGFYMNVGEGGGGQAAAGAPLTNSNIAASPGSLRVQPLMGNALPFPGQMTVNTMGMLLSLSGSTATMSAAYSSSVYVGLYTRNVSTLSLINSVLLTFGAAGADLNNSTKFAGVRWLTIHSSLWSAQPVLTQTQYWIATMYRTAGVSNQSLTQVGQYRLGATVNTQANGFIGAASVAPSTWMGFAPFYGIYSAVTAAVPGAIGTAELNKQADGASFQPMAYYNYDHPQTF